MNTTFFNILGPCKNPGRKSVRTKVGDRRPCFEFCFTNHWTLDRRTIPTLQGSPDCKGVELDADLMAFAQLAQRPLTSLEADFLWLALAVYFADRCASRHPFGKCGPAFWRRRIHVKLPVSDVSRWRAAEHDLLRTLEFLTEDDWSFEFEPSRANFGAERQQHFPTLRASPVEWTALFSGGLDSLAGALQKLTETSCPCLLVSGQTHNRIAEVQKSLVAELRSRFPNRVEHLGISYGFPDKKKFDLAGFESSQRARAFVHTTMGALAALLAGHNELLLFENGFGALNLPCDAAQFGSMNSRGTHPVFLRRMSRLVSTVFENTFRIVNPFTFWTKGQMLSSPGVKLHHSLLAQSVSCDYFPNYHHKEQQCGTCPSCLVRRLAFHAAHIDDSADSYSTDVFDPHRALREREWTSLAKLSKQAANFAMCLKQEKAWEALCVHWPDLLRTQIELQPLEIRDEVIALLKRHEKEWHSFSTFLHSNSLALAV